MAEKGKLTPKREQFCREYLIDLNATQAAIRAGYSKKTAQAIATEILTFPLVQSHIRELMAERSENTEITASKVLQELAKIGFSNIQDFLKEGFELEDIQKMKREHAAAINSIVIDTAEDKDGNKYTTVKFKLHDKVQALEKIGRHIGFFKEDNAQVATKITIVGG